jgi:uncharacterized coiled-coil DUF342 family protein
MSMTSRPRRRPRPALPALGCAGLLALSAGLVGCSDEDPLEQAVTDASVTLRTLGGGDSDGAEAAYAKAIASLSVVSSTTGDPSLDAAAGVTRAMAHLGQGTARSADAAELARRFRAQATELRGLLRDWSGLNSRAEAADAFDPSQQIATLRSEAQEHRVAIEALQEQLGALGGQMDALNRRIESLLTQASATRAEASAMRLEAATLSATEAAERAVQIRGLTRAADENEREGLQLQAQADMLQPELDDVEAFIGQRQRQIEVVADAIRSLTARSDAARTDAADLREKAAEIAVSIRSTADGFTGFINEEVMPVFDDAQGMVARAATEARSGSGAAADLTRGIANRRLGELAAWRARAHTNVARVFGDLASVTPPLPDARAYAEASAEHESAAAEQRAEAADRYGQAASAFRGLRLSGESREAVNRMVESLESLDARVAEPEGEGASNNSDETP